jgi:hypothetical protein
MDTKDRAQAKRRQELTVLISELKSLQKNARIYRQQRNSKICFRVTYDDALSQANAELEDLNHKTAASAVTQCGSNISE